MKQEQTAFHTCRNEKDYEYASKLEMNTYMFYYSDDREACTKHSATNTEKDHEVPANDAKRHGTVYYENSTSIEGGEL